MKGKVIYILFVLLLYYIVNACTTELDIIEPDNDTAVEQTYTMSIAAGKDEDNSTLTRALGIDETGKLVGTWNEGEAVTVFNETKHAGFGGSLVAQNSGKRTTLSGSITGCVSIGDKLLLKFLSPNYNSQDGTLTGSETSIDKVCDYSTAEVFVSDVNNGSIIATGDAQFKNQQAIVKFSLRNEDNTASVSVKSLTLSVGDSSYLVLPSSAMSELYVALPSFSSKDISLVGDGNDFIYSFTKTGVTLERGKYYTITVRMTEKSVMDYIMENIINLYNNSASDTEINDYIASMQGDGSWADINYSEPFSTWPEVHYQRLIQLSYAYINPLSTYYQNELLYDKIVLGIDYWMNLNITSYNWYHNQINEPQSFGLILIYMRKGAKKISSEIEERVIERWKNNGSNPEAMTGANRTETALHWMYFACLTEDYDLLQTALFYLYEPVKYVEDEGFQVDGSFFQHGPQLYIGGYGEVLLETVLQTAVCTSGTKYSLAENKLELIRDYVINSWSNVIRGEVMHWNAIGRQLTRPDFLRYPERRVPIIEKMIKVDGSYAAIYSQIKDRLLGLAAPNASITPCHKHFFRGDYTLHVEKDYSFSVRMSSSRTGRQEKASGENIKGYYLSFGATAITVTGREYLDIMPLWDWNKIPGVTAPQNYLYTGWWEGNGPSTFAGGVSHLTYGCSAYQYYDDTYGVNTGASKGYFFFDNEIVCLGAGINSVYSSAQTTLNQCWGQNEFIIGTDTENSSFSGNTNEINANNIRWVLHDGIGYYFPESQQVRVENKEKTGNWRSISTLQPDDEVNGKVFTLEIEHSNPVQDCKYSYIVIPNSTISSLSSFAVNSDIQILANTDSVQIVYHKQKDIYECVFYRACSYKGDIEIYSQQPCIMILQKLNTEYAVSIADPTQSRINMAVGIKEKGMDKIKYGYCSFAGVEVQFAGKTIDFTISR